LLTYAHDRGVVAAFARLRPVTGVVVLLRHAWAGSRETWSGPDEERPLDAKGRATAEALGRLLALFEPVRVVSTTPLRCVRTVEPLAAPIGVDVELDARFEEATDPAEAAPGFCPVAADGTADVG